METFEPAEVLKYISGLQNQEMFSDEGQSVMVAVYLAMLAKVKLVVIHQTSL